MQNLTEVLENGYTITSDEVVFFEKWFSNEEWEGVEDRIMEEDFSDIVPNNCELIWVSKGTINEVVLSLEDTFLLRLYNLGNRTVVVSKTLRGEFCHEWEPGSNDDKEPDGMILICWIKSI